MRKIAVRIHRRLKRQGRPDTVHTIPSLRSTFEILISKLGTNLQPRLPAIGPRVFRRFGIPGVRRGSSTPLHDLLKRIPDEFLTLIPGPTFRLLGATHPGDPRRECRGARPGGQGAAAEGERADLHQGCLADPPAAVPELPSSRSGRAVLAWRPTSRPGSGRATSPRWPGTGRCRPGSPWRGAGRSSSTTRRSPRPRSPCSTPGPRRAPRGAKTGMLAAGRDVHGRLGPGHARPRPRDGRGFRRAGVGPGPLSLLRDPHQPEARRLHLGGRVPAGEQAGGPPLHGLPRHQRRRADARRPRPGAGLYVLLGPGRGGRGRPRRLGGGQHPPSPPRRDRPPGTGLLRRDPPGPLPPQRQARGRPAAAGDLLLKKPVKQTLHWANATNSTSASCRASPTTR